MSKTAIVVLGAPNDDAGNLSNIALERCEHALREYQANPHAYILPTGGWGEHFNTTDKPHGHYIRQYLVNGGVPEDAFLECAESRNTIEDASCAKPIAERHGIQSLVVVTSDFHVPRARFLFIRAFPEADLRFAPATSNMDADEREQREAHEKRALARLREQFGNA